MFWISSEEHLNLEVFKKVDFDVRVNDSKCCTKSMIVWKTTSHSFDMICSQ